MKIMVTRLYFSIIFFHYLSHFELLPFRETSPVVSSDQLIFPRYMPCILLSWIGSAIPHRVNSCPKNAVDYFVYLRSRAFHGGNQITQKYKRRDRRWTPRSLHPHDDSRIITPPGRGGLTYISQNTTFVSFYRSPCPGGAMFLLPCPPHTHTLQHSRVSVEIVVCIFRRSQ